MKKAILISCYGWYEKRLKPIKNIIKNDYECKIVLSDFSHSLKTPISNKLEDCTYIHVHPYKKNLSFKRLYSHYGFSKKIFNLLQYERPDLIYILLPPNSLGKYCVKYINKHSECRLILDIIDLWPESMPLNKIKNTFPCKVWKNMRNKAIKQADYVFAECALYLSELKQYLPKHYSTLYLMKNQTLQESVLVGEKIALITPVNKRQNITIGYVGNINHIIDISTIEKIVSALVKEFYVTIKIIGDGEKRKDLVHRIERTGASVEFYGKIYDEIKKIEILSCCDMALNIMKENLKVGLTIKSIDYFSYGLPIINNIKGDTWDLVEKEMPGINIMGDTREVVVFVKKLRKEDHLKVFELYKKYFSYDAFNKTISLAFLKIFKEQL